MRNNAGNALLLIVLITASLGLAISAIFTNMSSVMSQSGRLFAQKRTQYVAEGSLLVVNKIAQTYLSEVTTPDANDLTLRLQTELPTYISTGYKLTDITVTFQGVPVTSPITTGTFRGMIAPQATLKVSYVVKTELTGTDQTVVNMEATVSLAQVSMFQFLYFIDLIYADFNPGPEMRLFGRVHSNGDLCLAGATGLYLSQVSSARRLMYGNVSACRYRQNYNMAFIGSGPNLANPIKLQSNNSNGCTNCGGTRIPWADYAPATWNGNALDSAHGVNAMVLPVPSGLQTQMGADGDDRWTGMMNNANLRFIVDPVKSADSEQVAKQKFAYKADIRVISGVWYLRDRANLRNWPGIPIWSDHPGRHTDYFGNPVGQEDLALRWGWTSVPRRYSYYEYNPLTMSLSNDRTGIISYGNLFQDSSGPKTRWRPGHWLGANGSDSRANQICPRPIPPLPAPILVSPAPGLADVFTPIVCTSAGSPGIPTALLNATRSGFHDGHIYKLLPGTTAERRARAKILPMNFDAEQFQLALEDTARGELGSYFGATRLMRANFNGMIYISARWYPPGTNDGFSPSDSPRMAPAQGSATDSQQGAATGPMQAALPQPLCSDNLSLPFDLFSNGGLPANRFRIPSCSLYAAGTLNGFPNAVRVINGFAIDPDKLKLGLSVVTSIGMYLQGEFNTQSVVTSPIAKPWIPTLVAADQINFMSNNWSDANASWEDESHAAARIAAPTTYNTAVLTGWARSRTSMPLSAFPSMMEDWRAARITFNGSIVVGFYPVYERYGKFWEASGYTYRAGERIISYDPHFQFSVNQPPGAPVFYVSALLDWKVD